MKKTPSKKSAGYKRFEAWLRQFIWVQDAKGNWYLTKDNGVRN